MNKIRTAFILSLIALVVLTYVLSIQVFTIPPLGRLLAPFEGVVQNREDACLGKNWVTLKTNGVMDSVQVFIDDRLVPHIYARNTEDLYFAQGYVTARLRLWQMDFMSYAAAGRLSEIFNKPGVLDYDRNQRRIGIPEAARQSLIAIEKDPETKKIISAYTKGINAYVKTLRYKSMPFEYKLLDYAPEQWTNLKTVLVMKQIGNTLSGREDDLSMSKLMLLLGETGFNKLYPLFSDHIYPVMDTLKGKADPAFTIKKPGYLDHAFEASKNITKESDYNPNLGSNSWVVSGKRTKTGLPILACDPHLGLSLPSIWVEMQLSAPEVNVYGVSIPGTPGIIIGFNERVAWGITNGADDVKDWYKINLSEDSKTYQLDGKWLSTPYRIEEIKRKGHPAFYDTIYSTVHGPIPYNNSFPGENPDLKNYALRWQLHQPSNEFSTFIQLNKAKDYNEFKQAIATYSCPSLNFSFACNDNTIAVYHQGKLAARGSGQGMFLLDGTVSDQIPSGYIPFDSLPHLYNPSCNYVFSANQHPTGAGYAHFYNGYYSENRAARIHDVLAAENEFDIEKTKQLQLDNVNYFAQLILPVLVRNVIPAQLQSKQKEVLNTVSLWAANYDEKEKRAMFFDLWLKNVKDSTWDEFNNRSTHLPMPADRVLLKLIEEEPGNDYFDNKNTPQKETAADIITQAFLTAYAKYNALKEKGSIDWADCNKVNLMHLTKIKSLSVTGLPSAGNPQAVNAVAPNWGPSWRMIVQMGTHPQAWGIYPGGQSGNIGGRYYDNFVADWNKGKYYQLHFYTTPAEALKQTHSCWVIQ
ncbi:MAG TPA: penicillin acylase family protein [Niastella sp.]